MSAEIIRLDTKAARPAQISAEQAWEAFDVAQRKVVALYLDPDSLAADRLVACMDAARLHRTFMRAMGAL